MWNLKYGTNEPIYKTETDSSWAGRRMDWEFGIGRCKLLHLEWINNKVLRYNTGNYIEYPVINHNRKYKKRMYICV